MNTENSELNATPVIPDGSELGQTQNQMEESNNLPVENAVSDASAPVEEMQTTETLASMNESTESEQTEQELSVETVQEMLEEADLTETSEVSETEKASLANLSKTELVEMARKATEMENLTDAADEFRRIRKVLDLIVNKERTEARAKYLADGGTPESFEYRDEVLDHYQEAYKKFAAKREQFRKKQEEEKLRNVELKKQIIEKVKAIAESEENPNSLEQIKELQRQWKAIRLIPSELNEELWNNYQHFLNQFYDTHSINNELKELDRKKNLEAKIELCKRMDELSQEPSMKKVFIMHKKYWEDWKNTGPVPREYREELWSRFKEAADKVFNAKMEELKALDAGRQENLDKKIALCEKAEEFSRFDSSVAKEWISGVTEAQNLFEAWKKIGMVPLRHREEIWDRFKKAINTFYQNKNEFFKNLDKKRQENLRKKVSICEQAEAIMNSEDWGNTTKELIRLQEEYKSWGPVPENMHEKIWNRFRKACDTFFERKAEHFAGMEQDQQKNLTAKLDILERLEQLAAAENAQELSNQVKNLQDEWNTYGFVPMKKKDEIQKRYKEVLDKIYQRIRKDFQQNNANRTRSHYEVIARQSEGKNMLHGEERRLTERIALLKKDMDTLQNNMGFFANSKSAGQILNSVNENIAATQKKIVQLQEQLRVLRAVKSGKPAEEPKAPLPVQAAEESQPSESENE